MPQPDSASRRPKDRAVTLVELIVVIGIISILAGLLMVGVSAARIRAARAKTTALLKELELLAGQYETLHGDYPSDAGGGGADGSESLYEALTSAKKGVQHEFAPEKIADTDGDGKMEIVDHWGNPVGYYHHRSYGGPPRETTFRLVSAGPDGEEDTTDDVRNY